MVKDRLHIVPAFGCLLFGFGWVLTGVFALIGNVSFLFVVTLISAVAGTGLYGYLFDRLPH